MYRMHRLSKIWNEFVSSSEQIWRTVALHHLLTNVSYAVNGCRQNESLIKTITIIHTTPVHQLMIRVKSEKLGVYKKQINY